MSEIEQLVDLLRTTLSQHAAASAIVVLTSPENPTGRIWLGDSIDHLLTETDSERVIFVFDHCFLFSGVHRPDSVPRVWNREISKEAGNWISVFDTGKIFDLDGEKLGFLVGGSKTIEMAIQDAVSILQYDISERQKRVFKAIFSSPRLVDYLDSQSRVCKENFSFANDRFAEIDIRILEPMAGPVALGLLPSGSLVNDYIGKANGRGVGLVSADHFFWNDDASQGLIRFALNRDSGYFAQAVERLCEAWA